jgi:hypothetical protein
MTQFLPSRESIMLNFFVEISLVLTSVFRVKVFYFNFFVFFLCHIASFSGDKTQFQQPSLRVYRNIKKREKIWKT